jgi:hypothetical protein
MANAPFCNVSIANPPGAPAKPVGLKMLPPGASLQTVINTLNNNFQLLQKGNFVENRAARRFTITRIFDTANPQNFVDVKQITAIQLVNPATGQLITWQQ